MQCMGKGETPGIDECLIWVGKNVSSSRKDCLTLS